MKKSRLLGAVCACILSFVTPPTVNAATISVTSGAAGTVRDGSSNVLSTASLQMINDGDGPSISNFQFEDQGVAEFELSGLGINSVNSAILTLFNGSTNATSELPVTIDIYGYSGDGSVGVSDYNPVGGMLIASEPYNGQTQFDIDVTDFINDQLQLTIPSSFAGFNLRLPNPTSDGRVFSFDGSNGNNPPVLNLTTVPVPPAVWLFGSGLLGLVGMARRKKAV